MVFAWRQQAITWTNVDLSSTGFCSIHLRAIFQEMLKIDILDMSLKIINLRLLLYLSLANELKKLH